MKTLAYVKYIARVLHLINNNPLPPQREGGDNVEWLWGWYKRVQYFLASAIFSCISLMKTIQYYESFTHLLLLTRVQLNISQTTKKWRVLFTALLWVNQWIWSWMIGVNSTIKVHLILIVLSTTKNMIEIENSKFVWSNVALFTLLNFFVRGQKLLICNIVLKY